MLETAVSYEKNLKQQGWWREHRIRQSAQGRFIQYEEKQYLNFNNNHYLDLGRDPKIIEAAISGLKQFGLGSGSANTLSGYTQAHEALCDTLAKWLNRDKVLLFPSGYQANLALLSGLAGSHQCIISDRNNHASLMDGIRLSSLPFRRYRHLNMAHMKSLLSEKEHALVVTESIFGMEGDVAPICELAQYAKEKKSTLLVDEAHSLGLYGENGQGLVAALGLSQHDVPVIMGTFGKALGVSGAMLAGRKEEMDRIMQSARPYLFTTAFSPMLAMAVQAAVNCVKEAYALRAYLFKLISYFRNTFQNLNLSLYPSDSPIQSLIFNDLQVAQVWAKYLYEKGIDVPLIRYPTVPKESPRLRFTLHTALQYEDIDRLAEVLKELA